MRAGRRGLPVVYGIIGGEPAKFAPLTDLYRQAAVKTKTPAANISVGIAGPGFLGEDSQQTKDMWWGHWATRMEMISTQRGVPMMSRNGYRKATSAGGALFVGHPEEVAERIVELHNVMGHDRHILEMDYGHVPQRDLLRSIELLGTQVKPLVDAELANTTPTTTFEGAQQ